MRTHLIDAQRQFQNSVESVHKLASFGMPVAPIRRKAEGAEVAHWQGSALSILDVALYSVPARCYYSFLSALKSSL